jgi:hypothetical protein
MKRLWEKPKLVVLVRGKPEEAVLNFCKKGQAVGGPQNVNKGCLRIDESGCSPTCSDAQDS